jgi:hypothetical protein
MQPVRSTPLMVAAIVVSAAIIVVAQLGHDEAWPLRTRQIAGFSAFGLNTVIAVLGCWTRHRAAWLAYLVIGIAVMILISAATPLSGLWLVTRVLFDSLSHR